MAETPRRCGKCSNEMVKGVTIPPIRNEQPALVVWNCLECGKSECELVYPPASNPPP
jgi:RNase P subunit RPR2